MQHIEKCRGPQCLLSNYVADVKKRRCLLWGLTFYDTAESIKDMEKFANYAQDGDKRIKIVTIADSHRM